MRFLIQRVTRASVAVEGKTVGEIGRGFLVFIGISKSDIMETPKADTMETPNTGIPRHSMEIAEKMTRKLLGLRIFEDENGKTNLDLKSVGGSLLMISQFTLYADCRKGNRPSFTNAGDPEKANLLYRYIVDLCRREIEKEQSIEKKLGLFSGKVEEGVFGADMKVELVNDGPFTVLLDSDEIVR